VIIVTLSFIILWFKGLVWRYNKICFCWPKQSLSIMLML
jgi:hypothetical protein